MKALVEFLKDFWWLILGLGALIASIALFVGPSPPSRIIIAGGAAGGAYAKAADDLAIAMRAVGVEATVVATGGSVDNLKRLQASDESRADVALVQGGVATEIDMQSVASLGGVFLEPVWVFVRDNATTSPHALDFQALRGLTVAAGAPGSGGRAAAERFLADQGISADVTLLPKGGADAAAAVQSGEAQAAILVASPRAGWVKTLLATPGVRLVPFERAPAFERLYPFAAAVTLREGVVDMGANLPTADTPLMAATAQIAVRKDLHPAIKGVLLDAIKRQYESGDVLSPAGAFPDPRRVDIPLSEEARRFYQSGPSFLHRVLPYWWANLFERAWIVILPALTLAVPLIRAAPPVYRWRVRSRIYRWYRDLTALEIKGRNATSDAERSDVRTSLAQMLRETATIEVPLGYSDELFRLRSHIAFVDNLIASGSQA